MSNSEWHSDQAAGERTQREWSEQHAAAERALARIADTLGVPGSPEEIAEAVDLLHSERDALRDLRRLEHVEVEGEACTCGSGGHPRKCKRHPNGFAHHAAQINYESAIDERAEAARAEAARLREQCAIHERSIATWGHAMGRVLAALGLGGAGHADALADRAVAEIAHLRAIVEAADALRVAVMRRVQVGSPGSSWLHDATDAYDRARRGDP